MPLAEQANIAEINVTEISHALDAMLAKGIVLQASRKETVKL